MLSIQRRLSSQHTCVLSVYLVTFIVFLPYAERDFVYSIYRSGSWTKSSLQTKTMAENRMEYEAAIEYLKTRYSEASAQASKYRRQLNMSIVVVTVPRTLGKESIGYLTRTVASLDQRIRSDDPGNVTLLICNVNAGPGSHRELELLRRFFNVVDRFPNGSVSATIMDPFEKEKSDYAFCMQQAQGNRPELVLMVEDDAVARSGLFHVIRWMLLSDRTALHASGDDSWSYVKLFYPERWQGYAVDIRSTLELLSVFVIGGSIGVALQAVFSRRRYAYRCIMPSLFRLFAIAGLYCVLVALVTGRQHLINMKRLSPSLYSLTSAPACCSPAIMYHSEFAAKLTRHLSENVRCSSKFPLDIAINSFASSVGKPTYLVEPNLFRHIGLVSTMKGYSDNPEEFFMK